MPRKNSEVVDITATLKHETAAAYLVNDGKTDVWLPKSQTEYDGDGTVGKSATFTIPEWLATEKGLI